MPDSLSQPIPLRIGVDVGGTFTDLVCYDPASQSLRVVKIPSTPPDFHRAVIDAVRQAAGDWPADIVHGSTVATNALLQRAGAPAAFVTTDGFRDMLLIGRQNRPELYALHVQRPLPLTGEENWFTVRERVGASGDIVEPLADEEVDRLIASICARGLKHVAVCLLFSFVNPVHERMIGRKCEAAGLSVSLSCDVLPEFREYERASTTVINACLRPIVREYLQALESRIHTTSDPPGEGRGEGWTSVTGKPSPYPLPEYREKEAPGRQPNRVCAWNRSLRIMHSSGGTLSTEQASASAARLVLSGPAGGVLGAAFVARQAGFADVITYDMGGTSTDVATVLNGQPHWTTASNIDGLPIALPTFDIHTVGAGGGSIASVDVGGALRVGPRSAGAAPGPACYGRGGTMPTVSDANLLLGRILPDRFLGGAMRVDVQLAKQAVEPIARSIGKSLTEAALGIVRVAEANMERAIRAVTSRRGHDPRQFTLVSFGGAGGLHACALAEALDIPRVLIPPYSGVLSALGMVVAPPVADASKTVVHLGEQLDDARLAAEFGAVSMQTMDVIPYEQTAAVEAYADARFRGQSYEIKVRADRPSAEHIQDRFIEAYRAAYGQVPQDRAIEIVTLRVRRIGKLIEVKLPEMMQESDERSISRCDLIDASGQSASAQALSRGHLATGESRRGPFLLIDEYATAYIPASWSARVLGGGAVVAGRA